MALYFKQSVSTPESDPQNLTLSQVSSNIRTVVLKNVFVGEGPETKDLLAKVDVTELVALGLIKSLDDRKLL